MSVIKKLLHIFINPNSLLLLCLILMVFFVPVLPADYYTVTYNSLFSFIFLLSALSLQHRKRKTFIAFALFLIIVIWVTFKINFTGLSMLTRIVQVLSFIFIIIGLIKQTAEAKVVNVRVIADSISGYLLVGIIYSIVAFSIAHYNIDAYHFPEGNLVDEKTGLSKMFYYTFVTYSSTGYGDITPVLPLARSFSTLISVTGQMYIAVIIALLVGKFSSGGSSNMNG